MSVTTSTTGRLFGVLGILFQIGMLFAYGFGSNFLNEITHSINQANATGGFPLTTLFYSSQFLVKYIFMAMFTLLGFGLLLSYLKYGTWSGMTTALLVIAVNIQLGFLMQKFWYDVFINGFGNNTDNALALSNNAGGLAPLEALARINFETHNQFIQIMPNVTTLRICLMTTISCLVAFTGIIGRIGLFETLFSTLVFNVGWNLCYYVNVHLNYTRSVNRLVFDDFGTDNVYIYGSFFGLIMMIILSCKPAQTNNESFVMNRVSSVLALTGTAFLFAGFALTGGIYPHSRNPLSDNLQEMNVLYALSASVVGTYFFSALLRGGNVGIREAMLGTIAGGVIVGVVSGLMVNMAIAISVGFFSGMLAAFYYTLIHPRLNRNSVFDSHGLMGTFWLVSIFGGVVFAPSMLSTYTYNNLAGSIFGSNEFQISTGDTAGLQLAYAGVAAGSGLVCGLIAALVSVIVRNYEADFNDSSLFLRGDYGLYVVRTETVVAPAHDSATHLRPGQQIH